MKPSAIVFPHAGGGSHGYLRFQSALQTVTVTPYDYPGHGRRIRESLLRTMPELARDGLERVRAMTAGGRPCVLLGHSMGARVAMLVAGEMARVGLPAPLLVVLSGSPAPQHHDERDPIAHLPDEAFLDELSELGGLPAEVRENELIREMILPVLRADIEALERWKPALSPVRSPLLVLHARDESFPRAQAEAWKAHGESHCFVESLDGGHFALVQEPEVSAALVDRWVARVIAAR